VLAAAGAVAATGSAVAESAVFGSAARSEFAPISSAPASQGGQRRDGVNMPFLMAFLSTVASRYGARSLRRRCVSCHTIYTHIIYFIIINI
jgi:hypothetical protein